MRQFVIHTWFSRVVKTHVQPIADRVAEIIKIISKTSSTSQNSASEICD